MNFASLRLPTFLLALSPLAGCLGAVAVEEDSASLERDRDGAVLREDGDRFERCSREWDCRAGDTCLLPDGDDRGDRPDRHVCGREPSYSCETDRECGDGAVCARDGSCVRLRDHKDECTADFRAAAHRIRSAVADGTMRPATARQLWARLMNAVHDRCGDPTRDIKPRDDRERDVRDDGSRDDGSRDGADDGSRDGDDARR